MSTGVPPARLRLLASAIAGRPVEVAAADAGSPAWTDGFTIRIDPTTGTRDQVAALVVQASLLASGSLDPDVLKVLTRRPALAPRYLAVEGHRALANRRHLLPPDVLGTVFDERSAGRSASPAQSLEVARSAEPMGEPPSAFGAIHPRRVAVEPSRSAGGSALGHRPRRAGLPPVPEHDEEEADPPIDLSSPIGGGGVIGRLLKKAFAEGRSQASGPPGADAPTRWSTRPFPTGTGTTVSTAVPNVVDMDISHVHGATVYPEWDAVHGRYRPEWCTVTEVEPPPEEQRPIGLPDSFALRRALGRLGTEFEHVRRQLQGDDIDIDAAVEGRAVLVAGLSPDEAVYVDSVRRRRDLSVVLLLDTSGSSGLPSATGRPVHHHQSAAAVALVTTLHELGDRVALYGFRSMGRSAVHVVVAKRFDDALDVGVIERIGGFVPGAYTRLGAAIRHGTAVLDREGGTARRLLVVLSDGLAYDHGYEGAYAEGDARRALTEARRQGIGCVCLSVGAGTDSASLERVFGTAAFASVDRAELLSPVASPLFRSALRSADLRRRSWLRKARTRERFAVERKGA